MSSLTISGFVGSQFTTKALEGDLPCNGCEKKAEVYLCLQSPFGSIEIPICKECSKKYLKEQNV